MSIYIMDGFTASEPIPWTGDFHRGAGRFPDGRDASTASGVITTKDVPLDWHGYATLRLEIHNPWNRPVLGGIELCDGASLGSGLREFGDSYELRRAFLLGEGVSHVVIDIAPMTNNRGDRTLDSADMRQVCLVLPTPHADQPQCSIFGLRLSHGREDTDELSNALPGDAIIRIKHLDTKCYTHCPEAYAVPAELVALEERVHAERELMVAAIRIAEINGLQTHYEHAALVAADVALGRKGLAWHFGPDARRRNLGQAAATLQTRRKSLEDLLSSRRYRDDEDDANTVGSTVRDVPEMSGIRVSGRHLVDKDGRPTLICSMSYHNRGELMRFFAPERHKLEIYAVGGGSRYDVEESPVYEAFHQYPDTQRVGWAGWCGHLIKDQWSMGGLKENVVLCLENPHILEGIAAYNALHAQEWVNNEGLIYVILAYELSYMCMCEESGRRFRAWLQQKHGHIEALNACWGTSYGAFEEIAPPTTEGHAPAPGVNRAAWYDWAVWNARRFTDHLLWTRDNVRKLTPNKPLCAGGTSSMLSASLSTSGIDEEQIINEVDDVILHEGRDTLGIDLFLSLSETPKPLVDPEQGGSCEGWMLNYLHGKSTIAMFWWPVQPSRQFPSSTMISPMHGPMPIGKVEEHLTTALDVRRLCDEIITFWGVPKQAAILYSMTNMLQIEPEFIAASTSPYLSALRKTYDAATCLDAGLTFVTEKQLRTGKAERFRIILAPCLRYLPADVFERLDAYVRGGGFLVLLGEPCQWDEYARPVDYVSAWDLEAQEGGVKATFGGLSQRYDQNLERAVTLESEEGPGEATATRRRVGSGQVWHLPRLPEPALLQELLDQAFEAAGVTRPMRTTDREGIRRPGLEARLVERRTDDLLYLANLSDVDAEYRIETSRAYTSIRELRSLAYQGVLEGSIAGRQVMIFRLQKPSARRA